MASAVGILLVTHNGLGNSLLDCVEHVLGGVPPHVRSLAVHADEDPERKYAEGLALVAELDKGHGVLLLSDIYGATPSNIGRRLCESPRVSGVAGVNLPMLLRVICCAGKTLPELELRAIEGGRDCIVPINSEGNHAATGCPDH